MTRSHAGPSFKWQGVKLGPMKPGKNVGMIARLCAGSPLLLASLAGLWFVVGPTPVPLPITGEVIHGEWDKGAWFITILLAGIILVVNGIRSKKTRPDATCINDRVPLFTRLTAQLIKGRTEAQIFIPIQIDVTRAIEYIKELEARVGGEAGTPVKLTLFTVYLTAMIRTIAQRPQLNRFVAGPKDGDYYQRDEISFSFVAKKTREERAKETSVKMVFSPYDTIHTVIAKMQGSVAEARSERGNASEREMKSYRKIPFWLLSSMVGVLRWLDRHNLAPASMIKTDVLHCSAFIANMGSMKGIARDFCSPYHHLFTWGTASLFFGIGTHHERLVRNEATGEIEPRQIQDIILTYDDRISEGMYGAKAIEILTDLVEHPEQLESVPSYPDEVIEELMLREAG